MGASLSERMGIRQAELPRIGGAVFAYLFHRIDQKALVAFINDPEKAERVLHCIRTDGYVLKNCKLYAWAYYKSRHGFKKPQAKAFGIERQDLSILSRLNLSHLKLKYEAIELGQFDSLVEGVLHNSTMSTYIGKFISKKMTFLIKSYGELREDIEHDLESAGLKAIYMHYPRFESMLHYRTVAMAAIKNTGQTKITYHVSPCRQRLRKNADGYDEAVHTNIEDLANVEAPKQALSFIKDSLESLVRLAEKGMRPDVQRFLMCCAGQYDEQFSSYLGMNNDVAVEGMSYSKYVKKATRHFGFTESQVQKLFGKLRMHI